MINAKGETIYTNAEIAYELGLSPATVNAVQRRLFGTPRYCTLRDAELIAEYIRSISIEEDAKRLAMLHNTIAAVMDGAVMESDENTRKRINKDINLSEKRG